jgi:hypothetical protein
MAGATLHFTMGAMGANALETSSASGDHGNHVPLSKGTAILPFNAVMLSCFPQSLFVPLQFLKENEKRQKTSPAFRTFVIAFTSMFKAASNMDEARPGRRP